VWIFRGIAYWAFTKALDAAWDELEDWLDRWEDDPDPDLDDERIVNVCNFVDEYYKDPDLTKEEKEMMNELADFLDKREYCQSH